MQSPFVQFVPAKHTWQVTPEMPHAALLVPPLQRFSDVQHPPQPLPELHSPPSRPPSSISTNVFPASLSPPESVVGDAPAPPGLTPGLSPSTGGRGGGDDEQADAVATATSAAPSQAETFMRRSLALRTPWVHFA